VPEPSRIINYPDPRLKRRSQPVEGFDQDLADLAGEMLRLMKEHRGVGLAAPQVGRNIRLFVINPTGEPQDARVYVNPELVDLEGDEEGDEGCLSIPGLSVKILRSRDARIRAQDLQGNPFEEQASGYIPRIWQHELDHLNGVLIIDRMGPVARLANRRLLKDLEAQFEREHPKIRH
jgi:peptide deformylase